MLETRAARPNQGDPLTEYRRYICKDWLCGKVFVYRNNFMEFRDVDNPRKLLRNLQRRGYDVDPDQSDIEFE